MSASEPPEDSVLSHLQPQHIDADRATNYSVTQELLGRVLGLYSHRRAELEKPGYQVGLEKVIEAQRRYSHLLQHLDPEDTAEVNQVRDECRRILTESDEPSSW